MESRATPALKKHNPDTILIKATLLLTSTLTVMATAIIAPSLPAMQVHFTNIENAGLLVRLVLTIPALFIVIGAPAAGFIIDRFGRKYLLVISTAFYGLTGSSGFVLPSLLGILMGRALLGLAIAGVITSVTTLIADYYIGSSRAQLLGLQAAFMGLGGTIFLTTGGFLADLDWRNPFLLYLAAFIILPLIIFALFEPERIASKPRVSSPIPSPGDDVTAAQQYQERVIPPQSHSKPQPGLDPRPDQKQSSDMGISIKIIILIYGIMMLVQITFYLVPVQLPFYLQALTGANAKQSGLAISTMTLLFSSGSLLSAKISKHINHINIIALSFGIIGLGYGVIGQASSYRLVLVGLAMGGLGFGFLVPNLNIWLAAEIPPVFRGRALGGLMTFTFLGQFLSPIVTQPVIHRFDLGTTYTIAGGLLLMIPLLIIAIQVLSWARVEQLLLILVKGQVSARK